MECLVKASGIFSTTCTLVSCLLLTGCIMFPTTHTRRPLPLEERDYVLFPISRARTNVCQRSFVVREGRADEPFGYHNRLGRFDREYGDGRVTFYALNETGVKMLWLMFPGIPIGTRSLIGGVEAALFNFDDRDRVRRFKIVDDGNPTVLEDRAKKWTGRD